MAENSNLATALAAAQGEMPRIPKNKKANYGMYADLDTIHEKILPILSKHNLAWTTLPGSDESGNDILTYRLMHGPSGELLEGSMSLRLTQNNMQQLGSALTYAKRYAISAVTGATTDEDDDGNTASGRNADGTGSQGNAPKKVFRPAPKSYVEPDEPSRDIHDDLKPAPVDERPTINEEQIADLFKLAKSKGNDTREKVVAFLNAANAGHNFMSVKQDDFSDFKKAVIESDWKRGEA